MKPTKFQRLVDCIVNTQSVGGHDPEEWVEDVLRELDKIAKRSAPAERDFVRSFIADILNSRH